MCNQNEQLTAGSAEYLPIACAYGVTTFSWHVGKIAVLGDSDAPSCGLCVNDNRLMTAGNLPTEFFNHQLMDCDADNYISLCDFVGEWGLPFSPCRYTSLGAYVLPRGKARKLADEAMKQHAKIGERSNPVAISIAEARHAIKTLQWVVAELRKAVKGEPCEDFTATLNAALCNGYVLGRRVGSTARNVHIVTETRASLTNPWESERLTCAICNQILDAMADEAPWRICEACGIPFKQKQSKVKATQKPRIQPKCCCERCHDRNKKRNQKAAAKSRIDHGIAK